MDKLYYVDVKLFDTFEETSSLIRRAVIAKDENTARDIVAKQLDKEVGNSCSVYEIIEVNQVKVIGKESRKIEND